MSLRTSSIAFLLSAIAGTAANAATVATFADPTSGPTPSLFQWNETADTLTGGWSGTGLTLETPGTTAPDYTNVTFMMTVLVASSVTPTPVGPVALFGVGKIEFFSGVTEILQIDFSSANLLIPQGLGSSSFAGANVVFSGPALGTFISIDNEAFSFGFVNIVSTGNGSFTTTAAFTSSADLEIPTPGSAAIVAAAAGLIGLRRRR